MTRKFKKKLLKSLRQEALFSQRLAAYRVMGYCFVAQHFRLIIDIACRYRYMTGGFMIKKHTITFIIACVGGWFFSIMRMPLPWTLGPLVTIAILKVGFHRPVVWSTKIRNAAMLVLGYVMGSPFTPQTGQQVISQLPAIVTLTLITITLCLVGGYITAE